MDEKKQERLNRVDEQIKKIKDKDFSMFFCVLDTKGVSSGSLEYIYQIAKIAENGGYDVTMLYNCDVDDKGNETEEDKFVGVADWLGEEFASMKHVNIQSGPKIGPSDIVFVPEVFLMELSSDQDQGFKNMNCKKVVVFQNYFNAMSTLPISMQLSTLGIKDVVCNSTQNAEAVEKLFPGVHTHVVTPYIDKRFGYDPTDEKKPIINLYCRDKYETKAIITDFYRRYPMYQWVAVMPIERLSMDEAAKQLRTNAITVWSDNRASFGFTALEAMKSGSVVIGKVPETELPWTDTDGGLNGCCLWFESFHEVADKIARCVRAFTTDSIPQELLSNAAETASKFSEDYTKDMMLATIGKITDDRLKEYESIKSVMKKKKD